MSNQHRNLPWLLRWSGYAFMCLGLLIITLLIARVGFMIAGTDFVQWVRGNPIEMILWRGFWYVVVAVGYYRYVKPHLLRSIESDHDQGQHRRQLLPRLERVVIVMIVLFELMNLLQRMEVI